MLSLAAVSAGYGSFRALFDVSLDVPATLVPDSLGAALFVYPSLPAELTTIMPDSDRFTLSTSAAWASVALVVSGMVTLLRWRRR